MSKQDHFLNWEEQYWDSDKKASRKQRKTAEKKDRSKFKKSNQDQLLKQSKKLVNATDIQGRVLTIAADGITVFTNEHSYLCSLKGSLKQERDLMKNLIAVGDLVSMQIIDEAHAVITQVLPRSSILSRADNLSRNKQQLIATNVDQVFITASVCSPKLKPLLIDRYIIAAQKGNICPIILINKVDLLDNPPDRLSLEAVEEEISAVARTAANVDLPTPGPPFTQNMRDVAAAEADEDEDEESRIHDANASMNLRRVRGSYR